MSHLDICLEVESEYKADRALLPWAGKLGKLQLIEFILSKLTNLLSHL